MTNRFVRPNWRSLENPELGLMNGFNDRLLQLQAANPQVLPNLQQTQTLLIASDYGGEHDTALYQSLSFLIADALSIVPWEARRSQIRKRWLSDGRRMAFKSLRDVQRLEALPYFLDAANTLNGLSITLLIDKRIVSLFAESGPMDRSSLAAQQFAAWKDASFEKLMRVVHFLCFFIGGLSRPGQDILWATDHDEIVANKQRKDDLMRIIGSVAAQYIPHKLGVLLGDTPNDKEENRRVEDLLSIPDLVAGALAELLTAQNHEPRWRTNLLLPPPETLSPKTNVIMSWFSLNQARVKLKKLAIKVEPAQGPASFYIHPLEFRHANEYPLQARSGGIRVQVRKPKKQPDIGNPTTNNED
jgi:hypothetical protein